MKNMFASSTLGAQILLVVSLLGTAAGVFTYGLDSSSIGLILLGYFVLMYSMHSLYSYFYYYYFIVFYNYVYMY